jgi:hypothetical protein
VPPAAPTEGGGTGVVESVLPAVEVAYNAAACAGSVLDNGAGPSVGAADNGWLPSVAAAFASAARAASAAIAARAAAVLPPAARFFALSADFPSCNKCNPSTKFYYHRKWFNLLS